MLRKLRPFVFEDSRIVRFLSKLGILGIRPIAISFGPFVFLKNKRNPVMENHEAVHFFQQLELLFVFQWILYALFYLIGLIKHRGRAKAYYSNPFEKEAYEKQGNMNYLETREWFSWRKYL
jgi:hypothetical protein|tara:strand:- start:1320 stop:1682 length:363 start_codon:yes stop_codon:yes gene_type:complete